MNIITLVLWVSLSIAFAQDTSPMPLNKSNEAKELYLSGMRNLESGKFTEAQKDFSKSIKLDPQGKGVYYQRALANLALGYYNQSLDDFKKDLENNGILGKALQITYETQPFNEDFQNKVQNLTVTVLFDSTRSESFQFLGIFYEKVENVIYIIDRFNNKNSTNIKCDTSNTYQ